jgi:hypothetical protein
MPATNAWDETKPAGSDLASTIDNQMRQMKLDIRERLALQHYWNDSLSTDGIHKEISITPTAVNTELLKTNANQSLTGSSAVAAINLGVTWNTSGTPTAIKMVVTDTASNAASLLMDLQTLAGGSKFAVDKAGLAYSAGAQLTRKSIVETITAKWSYTAGIAIPTGTPGVTTDTLYSVAGALYFNGSALATGSSVSGTTGTIAKFTSASAIGNSVITESGGIITAAPNLALLNAANVFTADQTFSQHAGNKTATIGGSPAANDAAFLQLVGSNSQINWRLGANAAAAGSFELVPSTAGGGTTFATAVLLLSGPGVLSVTNTGTAAAVHTFSGATSVGLATAIQITNGTTTGYQYIGVGAGQLRLFGSAYTPGAAAHFASGMELLNLGQTTAYVASTHRWFSDETTQRGMLTSAGQWIFGAATAADAFTFPVTIDQSASTLLAITIKRTAWNHGITTLRDTLTYCDIGTSGGGAALNGWGNAGGSGLMVFGAAATGDTTKSTAGVGCVVIDSAVKSGTSVGTPGANVNLAVIRSNATTRFIFDAEGDSHQDVGTAWTNFDTFDDAALLTALSAGVSRSGDPLREQFTDLLERYRDTLTDQRVVTFNDDGHHFVNWSRLNMLKVGAIRQLAQRIAVLEQKLLN